ncbi:glycoside hydrolase [Lichtheimia hyalospora FSU 10163]|nr:glycoside hydrolase [Lichtheimia hyalospora FSU 10163]
MMIVAFLLLFVTVTATASCHDLHHVGEFTLATLENAESILRLHEQVKEPHVKHFGGDTLAYVTPWNNRGYDVVKEFKGKFDYVSPVWYYVERSNEPDEVFKIIGEHDVDKQWMAEVRGPNTGKIVPRFQFRNWDFNGYQSFASNPEDAQKMVELLMDQVTKYGFDGIVVECGYPTFFPLFINNMAAALHNDGKEFIVVLPPLRSAEQSKILNRDIFSSLAQVVDRFSIMTYDYSSHTPHGGPSAPVDWIMDNIEQLTNEQNAHQLLIGINLYAMSYQETRMPEAKLVSNLLETLDDKELEWDQESEEHWYEEEDGSKVWMPTRKSIEKRVHLAEDYEVGISLWEVGQGLDYFYELL